MSESIGGAHRVIGEGRFTFDVLIGWFKCECGRIVDGGYVYRPASKGSRLNVCFCVECGEEIIRLESATRATAEKPEVTNE